MAALPLRICLVFSLSSKQLIRENAYALAKEAICPLFFCESNRDNAKILRAVEKQLESCH